MADSFRPVKHTPLSDLPQSSAGIELSERAFIGKVNLRGDPEDMEFASNVERALGIALPLVPNTVCTSVEYSVFWLGPNEWLIHCAEDRQAETEQKLRRSLNGRHVAITDVSDYYVVLRMTGDKALEVLSKGTPFDVHPTVFNPGACAQTFYGHATILLHCVDRGPTFDIQVRWSFAEYLWSYFIDGAKEYEGVGADFIGE